MENLWEISSPDLVTLESTIRQYSLQPPGELQAQLVSAVKPVQIQRIPNLDQRYDLSSAMGELARSGYLHTDAVGYWQIAQNTAKQMGDAGKQVESFFNWQKVLVRREPLQSLELLDQARQLCDDNRPSLDKYRPDLLYYYGFTYRNIRDAKKATEYYENALEAYYRQLKRTGEADKPREATILNDLGYAYALLGKYERADLNIKLAKEIREDLVQQADINLRNATPATLTELERKRREAILRLGMSWNTWGEISRYKQRFRSATECYDAALNIFFDLPDYTWQIRSLESRSEAHRRLAAEMLDKGDKAEWSKHIEKAAKDIDVCIELAERYAVMEDQDTAYRRKGRLIHDEAIRLIEVEDYNNAEDRLLNARTQFKRAAKIASDTEDGLEHLHNLTEQAFILDDYITIRRKRGEVLTEAHTHKLWQEYVQPLETLLTSDVVRDVTDKPIFEAVVSLIKGDLEFVNSHYDVALDLYHKALKRFIEIGGYGLTQYGRHKDQLIKQIQNLPSVDLKLAWVSKFVTEPIQTDDKLYEWCSRTQQKLEIGLET